jgi:hypothetical protein
MKAYWRSGGVILIESDKPMKLVRLNKICLNQNCNNECISKNCLMHFLFRLI